MDYVKKCHIIPPNDSNVSDHLPISTSLILPVDDSTSLISEVKENKVFYPRGKWHNPLFQQQYAAAVDINLKFQHDKVNITKDNVLDYNIYIYIYSCIMIIHTYKHCKQN